jgi:hypothetical protein
MRVKLVQAIVLGFICAAFAGCFAGGPPIASSASGPSFQPVDPPEAGRALLYIYRPWKFGSSLAAPEVYINEEKVRLLNNGGYTVVVLDPGGLMISTRRNSTWAQGNGVAMWLIVRPSHTYYVRIGTYSGLGTSTFAPELVPEHIALAELAKTSRLEAEKEGYAGRGNIREKRR